MRRISVKYAKEGMMLGMPLYDSYGRVLLKEGSNLKDYQLKALNELGVGELFIADRRADDIPVWPLVTPKVEGALAHALRSIMIDTRAMLGKKSNQPMNLTRLRQLTLDMVRQLFPVVMGEPNISGVFSLKDYDYVHPIKVAGLSLLVGKTVGFGQIELINLATATLLENIGNILIPREFMDKPGELTEAELKTIQNHSPWSAEILKRYGGANAVVIKTVLEHHERWNGSGYPKGLKGDNISLAARILAIIDTCSALASKRPYREAYLPHEAVEFIVAYSGELFDPELVRVFTAQVPLYPTGVLVKLNTGEVGIVTDANLGLIGRPKVRICFDADDREVEKPYDENLAEAGHQQKLIAEVMEY